MLETETDQTKPSRIKVLVDNYRESRQEGIKLAHSVFNDIAFTVALIGAIFTGGVITNEPKLQLVIPFLLGGIAIYGVQKLRVSSLVTCYMIFLEKEINRNYSKPVMIWNTEFVRRNVSAGRQSRWGHALLTFGIIVVGLLYGGICYWSIIQNVAVLSHDAIFLYIYILGCIMVYIFNVMGILAVIRVTKKYTPEYIRNLVKSRDKSSV